MMSSRIVENAGDARTLVAQRLERDADATVRRVLQLITTAAQEGKTELEMHSCFANAAPGLRERGFTVTIRRCDGIGSDLMNVSWSSVGSGE